MGDRTTAQDLRWKTFETTLDIGMLRDHIARLRPLPMMSPPRSLAVVCCRS